MNYKNIFLLLAGLIPVIAFTQADTAAGLLLPMKNGKICYETELASLHHGSNGILYERALKWMRTSFMELNEPLLVDDPTAGIIAGHGAFKVTVSETGNYYWIRPLITIKFTDSGYHFQSSDYYEKPIEKGISNEYSKIEYRWRDFRKGKPWSAEDLPLFKGIRDQSLSLLVSFENAMKRSD